MTGILCVIFFFSGASALIFELLWFQLAGLTFGNSVWATALVLASFMGGLALGSALVAFKGHKIKFPIRFYALLEILIGISGFLLVLLLPNLTTIFVPVYRSLPDQFFILNAFKAITAFLLMFLPATAMGATLPVLVKTLYRENPSFGRVLGILYGWNTFGATAGVIVGELFLVGWLGLRGAGLAAAGLNVLAAASAMVLYKKKKIRKADPVPVETEKAVSAKTISAKTMRLLSAGFLSGLTLLGLEVIWFRFMLLFFSATSLNFTVMLAVVLLGISLGGMAAAKWFRRDPGAHRFLVPVLLLNGIFIVLLYTRFAAVHTMVEHYGDGVKIGALSLFLVFPISFVSGTIFTLLGKALHTEMKSETKAAGLLTLANTVGAMIGSVAAGFVFLPYIGVETSFFIFALIYGFIALLVYRGKQFARPLKIISFLVLPFLAYLAGLFIFPFGVMDTRYLKIPFQRYGESGEKRVSVREGMTETLQYLQKDLLGKPYYHRLVTNSHTMSGTWMSARRYMKLFVYWPAAVHPGMKNALLICYGCGMTAKAMTDTKSLERIDIVDISRDIVEESRVVFPDPKENPVHDPRVTVHIEDGRFFLLSRREQYDLITAEPPPPKARGIVNLYTEEYFRLIRDRLADGGIVTYWLPVYQMTVEESKSILKGFCDVFENSSLWAGAGLEWMMVGVKNPGTPVDETQFSRQWKDPVIRPEIRTLGFESPEQFGAFFIADGKRLKNWLAGSLPLTDNYPKRLSSEARTYIVDADVGAYMAFMNGAASQTNFMNSAFIAEIWPAPLRRKTGKYFPTARIINEILTPPKIWRQHKGFNYYLHQCIQNPLLTGYAPWVLGSDQKAQRIISSVLLEKPVRAIEGPETYVHLASAAIRMKNHGLAEHYLQLMVTSLSRRGVLDDYTNFNYCTLRMYLAFIAGDKDGAKETAKKYLDGLEKRQGKESRTRMGVQFDSYLKWLDETLTGAKDD